MVGDFLQSSLNDAIENSYFPTALKQSNKTPVFKKEKRYSKNNHRPISILPSLPKVFEKCVFPQRFDYMNKFLSKHHCSFRKGYNTHHCLLNVLEKWKSAVNNEKSHGTLLIDHSPFA